MGNCCTEENSSYDETSLAKTRSQFKSSDNFAEERNYQSLEVSEAISDVSEDLEPRIMEKHAPS